MKSRINSLTKSFIRHATICCLLLVSASTAEAVVDVVSATDNEVRVKVKLPPLQLTQELFKDGELYQLIVFSGGGELEIGSPDLPGFGSWILIPNGKQFSISVVEGSPRVYTNITLPPLQPPESDKEGSSSPPFTRNNEVFSKDADYPGVFAETEPIQYMRGQYCTVLWIYPYQYNPVRKVLTIYNDLEVTVQFSGNPEPIPVNLKNKNFDNHFRNLAPNGKAVIDADDRMQRDIEGKDYYENGCELLIITHPDFKNAADKLAKWKNQRGIVSKVLSIDATAFTIRDSIYSAYETWNPAPSYLLFIGDAEFIPTWYIHMHPDSLDDGRVGTDFYYADYENTTIIPPVYHDNTPEFFYGRLSVDTQKQADSLVNRLIRYERTPAGVSWYYDDFVVAAAFQDGYYDDNLKKGFPPDSVEDRRFAKTSEDVLSYLDNHGYVGNRIYATLNDCPNNTDEVFPKYWSNAEKYKFENDTGSREIPLSLQKPRFAWNGNSNQIKAKINSGIFMILHRDHGNRSGWGTPRFDEDDVNTLNNGENRPVVWSINCQTGWFDNETDDPCCDTEDDNECFADSWLRHSTGGSNIVIASTRTSFSGYNDRLVWGWMNAIWPYFTRWHGDTIVPNDTPFFRMGEVLQTGKNYLMTKKHGKSYYRRIALDEFHLFSDPTIEIWTDVPSDITSFEPTDFVVAGVEKIDVKVNVNHPEPEGFTVAVYSDQLQKLLGFNTTDQDGLAVIMLNTKLIKGDQIRVLATKHNYLPKEKLIIVGEGESGYITENRTWDADTIKVFGNVTVEKDVTLTIKKGVYVQFMGHYHINVFGQLLAVGTETDSITFRPKDKLTGWHGIRFFDTDLNNQSGSKLHFCDFRYGKAEALIYTYNGCGGAVCCVNSSGLSVENCDIQSSIASIGGGVYCNNSDISIKNSFIHANYADYGGGIALSNSSPTIRNVLVNSNHATEKGGGVHCYEKADPVVSNSSINDNDAKYGGAIHLEGYIDNYPQPVFDSVRIENNDASEKGGGIFIINRSKPELKRCLVAKNQSGKYGGAVFAQYASITMTNTTVTWNQADSSGSGFYGDYQASVDLNDCIFYNSNNGEIVSVNYPGYSNVNYSNIRGGYTGTGNINSDPLFYSLTGDSAYYLTLLSPCLDTGDPYSPHDPDGSRADMGAFYFDHVPPTFYPPTANFKADTTYGYYPKTIAFTDLSQNGTGTINKWYWDFGDNTSDTIQHPDHLYSSSGNYTVSLVIEDNNIIKDTIIRQNYITLVAAPPVADFTADTTEWYKPLTVDFTDLSSGSASIITDWDWDFGDGSTSALQHPSHTYPNVGQYTVQLTVTDYNDSINSKTRTNYINVLPGTYVRGGNVSGTWAKSEAPYVIGGDIIVPGGNSLTIEAGAEVLFLGHYKFVVIGQLLAQGSSADSIVFTANNKDSGWHGLRFINSANSSLSFCRIKYGKADGPTVQDSCGGGIYCLNSPVQLHNCGIDHNVAGKNGGGIYADNSNLTLNNCAINHNQAGQKGGGLCSTNSLISATVLSINRNEAEDGGGIYTEGDLCPTVTEGSIELNMALNAGGGVYCNSPGGIIMHQGSINENRSVAMGGGIYLEPFCSFTLNDVPVEGNKGGSKGGGLYFNGTSFPQLNNILIANNSAGSGGGIYFNNFNNPGFAFNNILVTNNNAMNGGGLYYNASFGPALTGIEVTDNSAIGETAYGGGIYFNQSGANLNGVDLRFNKAFSYEVASGGAVYCRSSSNPSFSNCIINNNTAVGKAYSGGGAVTCDIGSNPSFHKTLICGNTASCEQSAPLGGGVYCLGGSSPSFENVTLSDNTAVNGAGGGIYSQNNATTPTASNTILWGNLPQAIALAPPGSFLAIYSDIEGGWVGAGNINADPLFENNLIWNYRLSWPNYPVPSAKSPCIDSGNPASPADPDGTSADMGVFFYDQAVLPECYDFGDSPDPRYSTLLLNDGARHLIVNNIFLGSMIDEDPDGQPHSTSLGDDNDGINDDDGIVFNNSWKRGKTAQIAVTASVGGYLNAWCDWNVDGDWDDAGEKIFSDVMLVAGGQSFNVNVPPNAALDTTFCRFRFCTFSGQSYDGMALNGEVEDYSVVISDETYATYATWPFDENQGVTAFDISGNNNHGNITNPSWTSGFYGYAINYNGSNYITVPNSSSLNITAPFSIQAWIKATGAANYNAIVDKYTYNAAGSSGFSLYLNSGKLRLSIYSGANGNGDAIGTTDLRDNLFHHIYASWDGSYIRLMVDGQPQTAVPWNYAPAPTTANLGIGRRLSGWGGFMNYTGVIDEVKISADPILRFDFGDAPDPPYQTLKSGNGASHMINPAIFLGNRVDPEINGLSDLQATGDDYAGFDDEDGVAFCSMMIPGRSACLQVIASYPGKLSAWMDFNIDGDWNDSGEQIFINQNLEPGSNLLTFNVPPVAVPGHTYARFRYSTLDISSMEGIVRDGEVEDYRVEIHSNCYEWHDGFEDYIINSDLVGQGNWEMWGGSASSPTARVAGDNSLYGNQSIKILGNENSTGDDILHQFAGCETGIWELSAWQYIPGNAAGGSTYFILLNQYNCAGIDCNWSAQLQFDPDQNLVISQYDGNSLPLKKNIWVKIMALIDLESNSQSIYYDDQHLVTKSWTNGVSGGGSLNIAAVNLFSGDLESTFVYYDDFRLMPLTTHSLELAAGWSGVSSYLEPVNSDIQSLMSPVADEMEILYNFSGLYWPGQNLNTLNNWSIFSGYVIKMNQDAGLILHGRELQQNAIVLQSGWNLIPVWCEMDAAAALGSIPGFVVAKGVANTEILWPDYNINTLGEMKLGKAYFVNTDQPGTLLFTKSGNTGSAVVPVIRSSTPWNDLIPTPNTHLVALTAESLKALQTGDMIAAFNGAGLCAGATVISGSEDGEALILFGDDPTTETIEGFSDNEPLTLKCYRQSTGEVFDLEVKWEESLNHSGTFETHGLSALTRIDILSLSDAHTLLSVPLVSPNPTSGFIRITGLNEITDIEILDLLGNVLLSESMYLPAGIDLSTLPKGICILIVKSEKHLFTKKLIIN